MKWIMTQDIPILNRCTPFGPTRLSSVISVFYHFWLAPLPVKVYHHNFVSCVMSSFSKIFIPFELLVYERNWTNLIMFWCLIYMFYICVGFFNEFSFATGKINIYWLEIKRKCLNKFKKILSIIFSKSVLIKNWIFDRRPLWIRLVACLIWMSKTIHINSYWCWALMWCIP